MEHFFTDPSLSSSSSSSSDLQRTNEEEALLLSSKVAELKEILHRHGTTYAQLSSTTPFEKRSSEKDVRAQMPPHQGDETPERLDKRSPPPTLTEPATTPSSIPPFFSWNDNSNSSQWNLAILLCLLFVFTSSIWLPAFYLGFFLVSHVTEAMGLLKEVKTLKEALQESKESEARISTAAEQQRDDLERQIQEYKSKALSIGAKYHRLALLEQQERDILKQIHQIEDALDDSEKLLPAKILRLQRRLLIFKQKKKELWKKVQKLSDELK
jgi:hypothetical protein